MFIPTQEFLSSKSTSLIVLRICGDKTKYSFLPGFDSVYVLSAMSWKKLVGHLLIFVKNDILVMTSFISKLSFLPCNEF